jgi:uroporphyrin-III C-methyltransferase/precorrin-2 dehydrogenase/sirohydrochlorin ferrochelatase
MSPEAVPLKSPPSSAEALPGTLLPIFLKLEGRKVLVVGGGPVAATKIRGFKGTGADVLVVAPGIGSDLRAQVGDAQANDGGGRVDRVTVVEREFQPSDLDGAWLAIAAAPPEVNRQVAAAAAERRVFLVAVDDPAAASAYGGGVVRRGGVTIAISTDGEAPALAGLLREALNAVIPAELASWVAEARAQRASWRADGVPMARRRPLLLEALNRLYEREPRRGTE